MKKILVPIDFSKNAANALRYAFELARRTGASVTTLHCVYPSEGVDNNVYQAIWIDDYAEQRRREVHDWSVRLRAKYPEFAGIPLNSVCEIGFPVSTVSKVASQDNVDLIVIGTTGATGLTGALLGSVASGVIGAAQVPVLAVPAKAVFHENCDVAFATDYQLHLPENDLEILQEAVLQWYSGKLRVVHVLNKPGEHPDRARQTQVSKKLTDIPHDFHYIHDLHVAKAVHHFLESLDAGVLVSVAHEHGLLHQLFVGSVTRELARHLRVPLLVLHG